jgi:uncharacterized protein YjdB
MVQKFDKIKNFTTEITTEKTTGQIERILAEHGANRVVKEYDGNGRLVFMAFEIRTKQGTMPVKLPANIDRVLVKFREQVDQGKLQKKYSDGEWAEAQAARVAWRIIKDWIEAQLWLLDIGLAKVEEIFLPYFYNPVTEKTMFEIISKGGFKQLALPEGDV